MSRLIDAYLVIYTAVAWVAIGFATHSVLTNGTADLAVSFVIGLAFAALLPITALAINTIKETLK